jgi:chromosome segregation ATPase
LDGRKVALIFAVVVLLCSLTAVYLNYRLTASRGALQQRMQKENLEQIEQLRARIASLRSRAKEENTLQETLNKLSQRLDEAVTLPSTKYPDVGRACSEVEAAIHQLEQGSVK